MGHVDSKKAGPGVFRKLRDLAVGDDGGPATPSRAWRIATFVGIVAAVVGLAIVAAQVVRKHKAETAAPVAATVSGAPAPVTSTPAPAPRPAVAAATSTALPATPTSPSTTRRTEVITLQTVPAVRDLVIDVNGHRYATAADGSIAVDPADRHGTVTVVGVRAAPALLQATFTSWADGVASPTRSLDELDGPVAQLGFTVHYRVLVTVGTAADGTVAFDSVAGHIDVPIGIPTFVPAIRTTQDGSSLAAQAIVYTVRSLQRGATSAPLTAASFTPGPEALWRIIP